VIWIIQQQRHRLIPPILRFRAPPPSRLWKGDAVLRESFPARIAELPFNGGRPLPAHIAGPATITLGGMFGSVISQVAPTIRGVGTGFRRKCRRALPVNWGPAAPSIFIMRHCRRAVRAKSGKDDRKGRSSVERASCRREPPSRPDTMAFAS